MKNAVIKSLYESVSNSDKISTNPLLKEDYNSDLQIEREVQKYLDDHNLWGDVSVHDGVVSVEIHWGDWKHDHWYCQDLMSDLGYTLINKVVTEEDGSDAFSAIHTYEKMDVNESLNENKIITQNDIDKLEKELKNCKDEKRCSFLKSTIDYYKKHLGRYLTDSLSLKSQ